MNGQWQIARQRDYRGGEVQSQLPEMVGRNQLLKMENAIIFPNGYVTAFHQTDTNILTHIGNGVCLSLNSNGTYTYYTVTATDTVSTGTLDTSLDIATNATGGTPHTVTGADISGFHKAVTFLGKLYCPNATGGILNLTDFTLISIPGKNIKHLYIYTNRLWGVCTDGTLIISDNGDATTWNALNVILLPNSEPIIDFIPVQGGAIVYSSTSIYAMYGSSYTDITFNLLLDRQIFTSGAVDIDGVVYIVGTRGVYQASLNGAAEIPHLQETYFKSLFSTFASPAISTDVVKGIYLQRFEAILFMWDSTYSPGYQGFVYYPNSKSYSKVNQLLDHTMPHILALNDANTDFLIGTANNSVAKSTYPSALTINPRVAVIQTRREDAESTRSKVWREFSILCDEVIYGVTITAIFDNDPLDPKIPLLGGTRKNVIIASNVTLVPGYNIFFLDIKRSQAISFLISIDNSVTTLLTDDFGNDLTDDFGAFLTLTQSPGSFTIQEFRLKYREAGPVI